MNLRELEYLIAIDDERHFHRAAERCFVSQPTLSGQLKKLEEELGVLLIERTNRRVSMTEAGSAVAKRAREIISGVRDIKDIAAGFQDLMAGDLHMGIIPTIAPYLLPIIMPEINRQFPDLKVWLYEYQTHVLIEKLANAELDVLILAFPVESHHFVEMDLYREPFRLALSKGQKLSRQKKVTLEDIATHEMMLLEEGHCLRDHVKDICLLAGVKETKQFQATSLETLRQMIGEGMGMTLMPELAIPSSVKHDSVRYIEFKDPKPSRRVGMLYRKKSYKESAFVNIANVIQAVLPDNMIS
ncbi:MAG: DNA-binding transcriptional regulator OxyR [Gammaproteobacteria bacterium]|nr:DNA-binding transcriptional regulator OxyR [Gammaproteobacteria bacterium]